MEKTGVGNFEMVDHMEAVPTEEEVAKQSQVVLKQAQKMLNIQPILNLLEKMISQARIIDTVIPSEVKKTPIKDLPDHMKMPSDMRAAIREQLINISAFKARCNEPMKQRSMFLSRFNPEEYKEAINICEAFLPILKKYDDILQKILFGNPRPIKEFYIMSGRLEALHTEMMRMPPKGGRRTRKHKKKGKKVKKGVRTQKAKKSRKQRRTTRKRRGGSAELVKEIKDMMRRDVEINLLPKEEYDCIMENKLVEEYVEKQKTRGWNYTPSELYTAILKDNIMC